MTFIQYAKLIKLVCDEEIERMREFLYCVEKEYDDSGDKYYIEYPLSNCPPDKQNVEFRLRGKDIDAILAILSRDESTETEKQTEEREALYEELRNLILYT